MPEEFSKSNAMKEVQRGEAHNLYPAIFVEWISFPDHPQMACLRNILKQVKPWYVHPSRMIKHGPVV